MSRRGQLVAGIRQGGSRHFSGLRRVELFWQVELDSERVASAPQVE